MNNRKRQSDPAGARPMTDEADIGSGEKHPAQQETEDQIRQIPPLPANGAGRSGGAGNTAPDGSPATTGRRADPDGEPTRQTGNTTPLSPER